MEIFVKETGELILGGNLGVIGFDMLSGAICDRVAAVDTPVKRAAVTTLVKAVGGMATMAGAGKLQYKSPDASQVLLGVGAAPLMTIASDWYKALAPAGIRAVPKSFARPMMARQPFNPSATAQPVRSQGALRVGVY